MPHITDHNPYYVFFVTLIFILATSVFYIHSLPRLHHNIYNNLANPINVSEDASLSPRIAKAEFAYREVVKKRQSLIHKYGPSPSQIEPFPADRAPWSPYTIWNFFPAAFRCPHELERVGPLDSGEKWTCGLSQLVQKNDCVIYTFERDLDSSWEASILETTKHCHIWGYNRLSKSFGTQVPHDSPRVNFTANVQLGPMDRHDVPRPFYTLETLMARNAHSFIDVLAIDIPNIERSTLAAMVRPYVTSGRPLPFGQLIVELHIRGVGFAEFLEWWTLLETAGLRPVAREVDLVGMNYASNGKAEDVRYTFLNIMGDNVFVAEALQWTPGLASLHPCSPVRA